VGELRVYVGTSGWRYRGWEGVFYPAEVPESDFLRHYGRYFSAVEVNSTYYRLPTVRTLVSWKRKTPEGFVFSVKLPRKAVKGEDIGYLSEFTERVSCLGEKLRAILVLVRKGEVLGNEVVSSLKGSLEGVEVIVKARNGMKVEGAAVCGYHSPTGFALPEGERVLYFRFHGKERWYEGVYEYEELEVLLGKVVERGGKAEELFLFFNNTATEGGLVSAARALEVAEGMGLEVVRGEERLYF
jgi:uncharacterized protein YecE (DUF72 family)